MYWLLDDWLFTVCRLDFRIQSFSSTAFLYVYTRVRVDGGVKSKPEDVIPDRLLGEHRTDALFWPQHACTALRQNCGTIATKMFDPLALWLQLTTTRMSTSEFAFLRFFCRRDSFAPSSYGRRNDKIERSTSSWFHLQGFRHFVWRRNCNKMIDWFRNRNSQAPL